MQALSIWEKQLIWKYKTKPAGRHLRERVLVNGNLITRNKTDYFSGRKIFVIDDSMLIENINCIIVIM